MKLYTEEQVKLMLDRARLHKQDDTEMFTNEYLLSAETPIELPSDEEIEKSNPYRLGGGNYNSTAAHKWQKGVEWVINKIQGGEK